MTKISEKINPLDLPAKLQVYWALDYLEKQGQNRFTVREVMNCLVEKKGIDISRQHINGILTKSKGAVNNSFGLYKLMEKGRSELKGLTVNKKGVKNNSNTSTNNYLSSYKLHPKIEQVSKIPFQSKLYKEAIQNALVEVISEVKVKTSNLKDSQGKDFDGDKLMQHVFGCDNQQPLIKFNALKTSLDSAEQRGLMNLFKGIVGIRDRKAHLNFIQKDPKRTFEYLVLASLLMNLIDEHSVA